MYVLLSRIVLYCIVLYSMATGFLTLYSDGWNGPIYRSKNVGMQFVVCICAKITTKSLIEVHATGSEDLECTVCDLN